MFEIKLSKSKAFTNELFLALMRTCLARGIAALGGLMLVVVLARIYGPSGVGVFALAQSVYLGASILARYGMDNALIRYVGQDCNLSNAKIYLRWSLVRSGFLGLIIMLFIFILRENIAKLFDQSSLSDVLVGFCLAIPAFTFSSVLAGFMKGVRKPATASLMESGCISLLCSIVMIVFNELDMKGIALVGWAVAIASWMVVIFGLIQVWRHLALNRGNVSEVKPSRENFFSSSHSFFIVSISSFMQQVVSILIAGWMLSESDLGLFKSAERVALLISFSLLVINSVFPPRFAKLYRDGDFCGLNKLVRKGTLWGVVLALPLSLSCLIFPNEVLLILGQDFGDASLLLQVIAIAQLINVATGSVGFLLNMTGHEKLMRNIVLASNFFGIMMFLTLIPVFGTLGAALSLATLVIAQNITSLVFVWRRLGIWTLPIPNLLSWMHTSAGSVVGERGR